MSADRTRARLAAVTGMPLMPQPAPQAPPPPAVPVKEPAPPMPGGPCCALYGVGDYVIHRGQYLPSREEFSGPGHLQPAEDYDAFIAFEQRRIDHQMTEPGPTPEKWAYAPGVTDQDIAAAVQWCRANYSSSPIHLVAAHRMVERTHPAADTGEQRRLVEAALSAARALAKGEPPPEGV